mmetsp:Transcript_56956/g.185073  ORF Transcript_56956/g.185073 Transcript_56956/m.185073 type:complete len:104 (-) Transcript_56956:447-758(-)|eukprot:CAMPEP_0204205642 /NCGR_PEP_ID=MMETSP0361-20130328/70477_1 /ASSEMBLY_ACC=CAM_ASM_000343 /TAXON_ID=268821 /ORGANISM="Scrippsiella Hangoei, Strain SHTV-5" /LENGTH=103 /DNA_ID=CAMNT_0051168927 /DNA_START=453 /DNA_END=764 /DNA_ORIENTATION=-
MVLRNAVGQDLAFDEGTSITRKGRLLHNFRDKAKRLFLCFNGSFVKRQALRQSLPRDTSITVNAFFYKCMFNSMPYWSKGIAQAGCQWTLTSPTEHVGQQMHD